MAQAATEAFRFAELLAGVGAAILRHQQRRHRVPTVAGQHARRAVVAGADQHVGLEGHDPRDAAVNFLGPLHLGVEVAVFARAVGVFEVDEEEVVVVPILFEHLHLLVERLGLADNIHADQSGQALVHRIDGDRRRPAGRRLPRSWAGWAWPRTPAWCSRWPSADRPEIFLACSMNSAATWAVLSLSGWSHAGASGGTPVAWGSVSATLPPRPFPAKHDDKAMLFHRLDKDLDAGNRDLAELDRQRGTLFGGDAPGTAVGDVARCVERAEVAADGDIAFLKFETDAGRLQRPATDQILERIVAEQPQVPGPAARADAGLDRDAPAADSLLRQGVEIRRVGRFPVRSAPPAAAAVPRAHRRRA